VGISAKIPRTYSISVSSAPGVFECSYSLYVCTDMLATTLLSTRYHGPSMDLTARQTRLHTSMTITTCDRRAHDRPLKSRTNAIISGVIRVPVETVARCTRGRSAVFPFHNKHAHSRARGKHDNINNSNHTARKPFCICYRRKRAVSFG